MPIREIDSDVDLLALHAEYPERYPYLLQTAASSAGSGSFDILFRATGTALACDTSAFADVAAELPSASAAERSQSLPFTGGWFVYFGYEWASAAEPNLALPAQHAFPDALVHRSPGALIVDRRDGRCYAVAEPGSQPLLNELCRDAAQPLAPVLPSALGARTIREEPAQRFVDAVHAAKAHIRAGDVYQVNLSRRWDIAFTDPPDPAQLYSRLCESNPAPFAGSLRHAGQAVLSSSPERLLKIDGRRVETRPIAGTRPRSAIDATDQDLRRELASNEKERAEHVMLIDLERNDLGRIAVPGSVRVEEFMGLESFAHVHHIVSSVVAELADGVRPIDAVNAVFPGGTITGCPKYRCMQIIAALEAHSRGPYTGTFGYVNLDGSLDLNILIRTLHVTGSNVSFRAGAGIVADSIADAELAETRAKAEGLLRAFERVVH